MDPFVTQALVFVTVFVLLAAILLYIAKDLPTRDSWSSVFRWLGILHLLFAYLSLFAVVILSATHHAAPCGLVPNTTSTTGGVTTIAWMDTCLSLEEPAFFSVLRIVFIWFLGLEMAILAVVAPLTLAFQFMIGAVQRGKP